LDTGDAAEPLRALLATHGGRGNWGSLNFGRYSNKDLDAALKTALGTMEDSRRLRLLQEATRIGMRSYGIIPLYFEINQWAMRKGMRFLPRVDGATLAMNAAPAR
jgi:peptide/nickel transport system substrate-binding protein